MPLAESASMRRQGGTNEATSAAVLPRPAGLRRSRCSSCEIVDATMRAARDTFRRAARTRTDSAARSSRRYRGSSVDNRLCVLPCPPDEEALGRLSSCPWIKRTVAVRGPLAWGLVQILTNATIALPFRRRPIVSRKRPSRSGSEAVAQCTKRLEFGCDFASPALLPCNRMSSFVHLVGDRLRPNRDAGQILDKFPARAGALVGVAAH